MRLHALIRAVTMDPLSQDPDDLVARYVQQVGSHLTLSSVTFGAWHLLAHGPVKIVLVAAGLRVFDIVVLGLTWHEYTRRQG